MISHSIKWLINVENRLSDGAFIGNMIVIAKQSRNPYFNQKYTSCFSFHRCIVVAAGA